MNFFPHNSQRKSLSDWLCCCVCCWWWDCWFWWIDDVWCWRLRLLCKCCCCWDWWWGCCWPCPVDIELLFVNLKEPETSTKLLLALVLEVLAMDSVFDVWFADGFIWCPFEASLLFIMDLLNAEAMWWGWWPFPEA